MKIIRLFLLFVGVSISMSALKGQTTETTDSTVNVSQYTTKKSKPKIWFGPRFGLDLAHFTVNTNEIGGQLNNNYQVGIMCQIGEKLYIQPELYYSSYKFTEGKGDSAHVNMIKVPLMLGCRILNLGILSLHIQGGPLFKLQLNNKEKFKDTKFLSWQIGVGTHILSFITADLRYTLQPGKSISKQVDDFNINTTGLNLILGLRIR